MEKLTIKWHKSISEIPKSKWDSILKAHNQPFYNWDWLNTLEKSESICSRSGWQPLHITIWRNQSIVGVAPLYLKNHSYGEFIFDHNFAQLANSLGIKYYPKLVGMSPLSPVKGYRFHFSEGESEQDLTDLIFKEIDEFAINNNILSCNFLYVDYKWARLAENANCTKWLNKSSLWTSSNEKTFSDYLNRFNANQRRNIKRERNAIKNMGINISIIKGGQIKIKHMKLMHQFYKQHCARWGIWGSKYLTQSFFEELINSQAINNIILFCAYRGNIEEPIAMSLCVVNNKMLWGRYWGCKEEINYLHFELCYYSPIEWAISNDVDLFDPGAGGDHKNRRGFIPISQISMHRWYDIRFETLIRDWLAQLNQRQIYEIKTTNNEVPFKK